MEKETSIINCETFVVLIGEAPTDHSDNRFSTTETKQVQYLCQNVLLNENLLSMLNLSEKEIEQQIQITRDIIKKRDLLFRKGLPFPSVKNKVAIIVDDGLASGYTMLSAIEFIKRNKPQKIVAAVPTGSKGTVEIILPRVDELVCLNIRSGYEFAVANAYENWYDLEDDEVISILQNFKESIN